MFPVDMRDRTVMKSLLPLPVDWIAGGAACRSLAPVQREVRFRLTVLPLNFAEIANIEVDYAPVAGA